MSRYRCSDCGWIYDEAKGDPTRGIAQILNVQIVVIERKHTVGEN